MKLQEKAMLRALLSNTSGGENLLRYFSPELTDELQKWPLEAATRDFSKILSQKEWTESIHYSWFVEPLEPLSTETKQLFLSLLEKKQADKICQLLEIKHARVAYSPFMRPFLINELKKKIQKGVEIINQDYLPPSEFAPLLTLKKQQLFNLIDLLGVHDLSADLRQIVDKEMLRKIYNALSAEQLQFLHYCTKQPIKWVSPKISLSSWDGAKKRLQHILHGRGLIRLGRALYDENESFKWLLLHRLDIGRAGVIEKIFRQKQDLTLIPYFKNQLLHILRRYIS